MNSVGFVFFQSAIDVSGREGVEMAQVRGSRTEYDPLPGRLSLRPGYVALLHLTKGTKEKAEFCHLFGGGFSPK